MYNKDSRKTISTNPKRRIFEFFTSMPSQGDTKLKKLLACPKKSRIWHCINLIFSDLLKMVLDTASCYEEDSRNGIKNTDGYHRKQAVIFASLTAPDYTWTTRIHIPAESFRNLHY